MAAFAFFATTLLIFLWSLGAIFALLYLLDAIFGGEDFGTSEQATQVIAALIVRAGKEAGLLIDLGSCRGTFALRLQELLPSLEIVGIDNSLVRVLTSIVRKPLYRKGPSFSCRNIYDTDFSRADVLNVYLPREMLPALLTKMRQECRPETLIVMYRIEFEEIPYSHRVCLGSGEKNYVTAYTIR